jgi:hypothetical protein
VGVQRPGDRSPDWREVDAAAPHGNAGRALDIAGLTIRLEGLSDGQAEWIDRRYGVFARDGVAGRPLLTVKVTQGSAGGYLQLAPASEIYRLVVEREKQRVAAWSYRFAGWFDTAAGTGCLALCEGDGRSTESSLENFLRVAYAHLALEAGGFLFHAAGVVKRGWAYLFFGPSGSGKTTVSTLSVGARVVSDDLILVLPGKDQRHEAVSIPFRGHMAELPESQASFPIAGFYRLVQDTEVRLVPLERARAVSEVVGSLPFVTDRAENGIQILDAVGRAVQGSPAFRLHFRKDATFWQVVERDDAGARDDRVPAVSQQKR